MSPRVTRLSGDMQTPEGFRVETEANGSTYRYTLRVETSHTETPDDEPGTVRCTGRRKDGEDLDPETTEAVEEALEAYGYEVVE